MTPRQRQDPDIRKASIIAAAVRCAERAGFHQVTREMVAGEAGCSPALITYYWLGMGPLMDDVMELAVATPLLGIVAHGLAARHPAALGAPQTVREAAAGALVDDTL